MKKNLGKILTFLWCKDLSLMKYWLEHWNWKLFFDWIFFWKYQYVLKFQGTPLEHAKKFIEYFADKQYKENLIKWLDQKSIDTVNQIEKNIKFILDNTSLYLNREEYWIKVTNKQVKKYIKQYTKDMYLPIENKEENVFYFKHGIGEIPDLKEKIKGKDILDCGAFIGDSAMMFSKEIWFSSNGINKIYCLEPEENNFNLLKQTIEMNEMNGKIIPLALGVAKQQEKVYLNSNGAASSIWLKTKESVIINVDMIDNIVKKYGILPWLIKWDIEWLEYDSILWWEQTIKTYKPILLISIYHNWKDFYTIKALIESWNLWYNFIVRHLSTHLFEETMLICY